MDVLTASAKEFTDSLRGLRKYVYSQLGHNQQLVIYYPTQDSVHVRRVTKINVFDEDAYFLYALRKGAWGLEPDMSEAPF